VETALAGAAFLGIARRASAQKARPFTITYLALLPGEDRNFVPRFLRRLDQLGYVDGQNLHFVYRSAEGRARLATTPAPTGSPTAMNTTGMPSPAALPALATIGAERADGMLRRS
jgi:hypothetical protein